HPEGGSDLIGDLAEGREIQVTRVGGPTGDDHLRLLLDGLLTNLIHVNEHGVGVHAVGGDIVELAGEVQFHAVGQVTTVGQGQTHDLVTRLGQGHQDRGVGLGTGV